MNPDDIELNSVNWEFGMLLTPAHFVKQERFLETELLWVLRHTTSAYGLVGGGPRMAESERGAAKHDPVVSVEEDESSLLITVTQCRAITPAGGIVEITPDRPLSRRFERAELDTLSEAGVYVTSRPFAKEVVDGSVDEFNPEMRTERRPAYSLSLGVPSELSGYSVCICGLRRQRYGSAFEKDASFVPACTIMCAHSELMAAWRSIVEAVSALTDQYTELYRAMREFLVLITERGIETNSDVGAASFVEHMLTLLQTSIFELLDPTQPPQQFFGKLKRLFYCAAVRFDLTPAVQQYFETLKMAGETEFTALLHRQRSLLMSTRSWRIGENLAAEVRAVLSSLSALQRLERAMEGKYVDFRISPSLDAMNFIFDRGGKVLYRIAAKATHVQGAGDDLNIYFSQLRLEGRDKYRLILVAEENAAFRNGERLTAELRINESSGFRRAPVNLSCEVTGPEQRNFEFDFDAPDIPVITDLIAVVAAHQPIRTALLFTRHRFYSDRVPDGARGVSPVSPERSDDLSRPRTYSNSPEAQRGSAPGRSYFDPARDAMQDDRERAAPWDSPARDLPAHAPASERSVQRPPRKSDAEPAEAPWPPRDSRPGQRGAPWDRPDNAESSPDPPSPPPRRRRLE